LFDCIACIATIAAGVIPFVEGGLEGLVFDLLLPLVGRRGGGEEGGSGKEEFRDGDGGATRGESVVIGSE